MIVACKVEVYLSSDATGLKVPYVFAILLWSKHHGATYCLSWQGRGLVENGTAPSAAGLAR